MDKKRLNAILEAYGADPKRWPDAERDAAARLLTADSTLAAERRSQAALDRMLAKVPQGLVHDALRTRILETAPPPQVATLRNVRKGGALPFLGGLARVPNIGGALVAKPVAILAVAIFIGLGAGALLPSGMDSAPSDTELLAAMWGNSPITQDGANL